VGKLDESYGAKPEATDTTQPTRQGGVDRGQSAFGRDRLATGSEEIAIVEQQ
jgi:hypothetical protein